MVGLLAISYACKMEAQAGFSGPIKVQRPATSVGFERIIYSNKENCDRRPSVQTGSEL